MIFIYRKRLPDSRLTPYYSTAAIVTVNDDVIRISRGSEQHECERNQIGSIGERLCHKRIEYAAPPTERALGFAGSCRGGFPGIGLLCFAVVADCGRCRWRMDGQLANPGSLRSLPGCDCSDISGIRPYTKLSRAKSCGLWLLFVRGAVRPVENASFVDGYCFCDCYAGSAACVAAFADVVILSFH